MGKFQFWWHFSFGDFSVLVTFQFEWHFDFEETQHILSCKENISGHRCESCCFVAETERKLRKHKVIKHTLEGDDWNGVWYGCSICKNSIELANYFRNMTWSKKEKLTAQIMSWRWADKENIFWVFKTITKKIIAGKYFQEIALVKATSLMGRSCFYIIDYVFYMYSWYWV